MTISTYPTAGSPNTSELIVQQPMDAHTVQGQLMRLQNNVDLLGKAVSQISEATAAYHRVPSEPSGRAIAPPVDGTSQAHDRLDKLNDSLECEIDRLQDVYYRLDL